MTNNQPQHELPLLQQDYNNVVGKDLIAPGDNNKRSLPSPSRRKRVARPGFNQNSFDLETDDHDDNDDKQEPDATSPLHEEMIDNSNLVYLPIFLRCGVTVYCRPDVLARCPMVLRDLQLDLAQCIEVLPDSVTALVRRTAVWVNTTYYYGPRKNPRNVNHSTAHHHQGWLLWARDKPEKAQSIEIYSCFEYRAMRWHWNGCGLILHELCHLLHQFCLENGLENVQVKQAYERAKASGKYDQILRRDWAGLDSGDKDMAYALVNHKEFFAEMSVTYLCNAYTDSDHSPPHDMDSCSPPLLAPSVVQRIQAKQLLTHAQTINNNHDDEECQYTHHLLVATAETDSATTTSFHKQGWFWLIGWLFDKLRPQHRRLSSQLPPHCNKFYPFTRGQLKAMDRDLYHDFEHIWEVQIAEWQDEQEVGCWSGWRRCFSCAGGHRRHDDSTSKAKWSSCWSFW